MGRTSNHRQMDSGVGFSNHCRLYPSDYLCTGWFWWGRFEIQVFCWHKHWQMHYVVLQGDGEQSHLLCRRICRSLGLHRWLRQHSLSVKKLEHEDCCGPSPNTCKTHYWKSFQPNIYLESTIWNRNVVTVFNCYNPLLHQLYEGWHWRRGVNKIHRCFIFYILLQFYLYILNLDIAGNFNYQLSLSLQFIFLIYSIWQRNNQAVKVVPLISYKCKISVKRPYHPFFFFFFTRKKTIDL